MTFALPASSRHSDRAASPSTKSPGSSPTLCRQAGNDAEGCQVRFTHSPLIHAAWKARQHERLRRSGCESDASLSRHLQTDVSVERHLSRIRPCLTRPLARCLSRALRQLRGSALPLRAPCGFRLSENLFGKTPHRTRTKRFSEPSEKAPLGLGSGAHSRRLAQECPE